ncbi:hypothetical protein VP01_5965g1, partial [Puccinia sorghi]
ERKCFPSSPVGGVSSPQAEEANEFLLPKQFSASDTILIQTIGCIITTIYLLPPLLETKTTIIKAGYHPVLCRSVASPICPQWEPWNNTQIPPTRVLELFCMSLADFIWLADKLRIELAQDPVGCGQPLSVEALVGVGLYRLAHGATYFTLPMSSVSKETADKASGRFFNAVIKVFRFRVVNFPSLDNAADWSKIMESFERRQGIPRVVGAIDGTHIPIIMTPDDNWKSYINRKSWASIVFQCVLISCPFQISGGGEGSIHHSRVFRRSILGQSLRSGARIFPMILQGTFLVGDAGYPGNQINGSTICSLQPGLLLSKHLDRSKTVSAFCSTCKMHLHCARNNNFVCMILQNLLNCQGSLATSGGP